MSYCSGNEKINTRFYLSVLVLALLIFLLNNGIFGQDLIVGHNKEAVKHRGPESKESMIGERMFYGLVKLENGRLNCEGCHSLATTPKVNWNPSAYDLSVWMEGKTTSDLKKAFDSPSSDLMETSHKNAKLNDDESKKIMAYLVKVKENGQVFHKDFPIKLLLFFIFGLLMALALVDLIFTKKIKYKVVHVLVLIIGLAFHMQMAMVEATNLGRTKDYAPDQPIKFSHKVHAGDNKIDCKYCHTGVFDSKSAGIPSANLCINCHNVVRNGRNSGKYEITKIHDAIDTKKPIEWIRVHKLPDHVYFNHAQHVVAGKVECATCHGKVETMDIMAQYSDLSMGWCVNCHRQTKVNFEGNDYYKSYVKLHDDLKSGKIKQVTVEQVGGLDCMKCHY